MKKFIATVAVVVALFSVTACSPTSAPAEPVMVTVTSAVYANNICLVSFNTADGNTGLARTIVPTECFRINVGDILPFDGMFVTVQ